MGTCWAFSPRRAADKAFSAQSPPTWYFNFERPTCKGAYRWRFEITIETMKGKGPCLPLIKMVEQALCLHFFCISIYIILCTPHIISILIPLSFPAIPPFAPNFPPETMFFGIKPEKFRRRFLPYSYRFLPLPCCRPKKVEKFFRAQSVVF